MESYLENSSGSTIRRRSGSDSWTFRLTVLLLIVHDMTLTRLCSGKGARASVTP